MQPFTLWMWSWRCLVSLNKQSGGKSDVDLVYITILSFAWFTEQPKSGFVSLNSCTVCVCSPPEQLWDVKLTWRGADYHEHTTQTAQRGTLPHINAHLLDWQSFSCFILERSGLAVPALTFSYISCINTPRLDPACEHLLHNKPHCASGSGSGSDWTRCGFVLRLPLRTNTRCVQVWHAVNKQTVLRWHLTASLPSSSLAVDVWSREPALWLHFVNFVNLVNLVS